MRIQTQILGVTLALCAACASETSGERVRVQWQIDQAAEALRADFDTQTGYRVHLDEARVELSGVYLYAPAAVSLSAVAWLERSFVSVAHAHGGVDIEKGRRVLAEWTKPMSIDALSDATLRLPESDAEDGRIDAVKVQFAKGVIAHVRGQAERDGKTWTFEADVTPNDDVTRFVELLGLDEMVAERAVVHVGVHPQTWLDLCEFSHLGEDQASAVPADNQVGRAISIGVRSPNAFSVNIARGGDDE